MHKNCIENVLGASLSKEVVDASHLTSSDHTDLTFMSILSAADHTYSEGLTGPLHPYPGGLGKVRHFITLKEERGQILSADLRSNDKQWSEAAWVLAKHSTQA